MDLKKLSGKFIGANEIDEVVPVNEKTYLGNNKLKVKFKSEKEYIYPEEVLKDIVSDEKSDDSILRDKRVNPVVEKILAILVESEITLPEINYAIGPKLTEAISEAQKRANKVLTGKEDYELNLMDIEKILREHNKTLKKHGNKTKKNKQNKA